MSLKRPPDPLDVNNHREARERRKALRCKRLQARRWHIHAVATIDALWAELIDRLATAEMADAAGLIAEYEAEMTPYFRP